MKLWLSIFLVMFSRISIAADDVAWRWVKAASIVGKRWEVSQGQAKVSISGEKFKAKLFSQDSGNKLQIVLVGTIKNGRITAKEEIQGSDYTGSVYQGIFQRKKKKWGEPFAGTKGAESITLSDGWNMIGINQDLH